MGDYRDSPTGPGDLGIVPTDGFASGNLETLGDADVFETRLISGLTYTIEQRGVSSGDGSLEDSYLYLVDGSDTVLTEDDDAGGDLNSLIEFTPDVTGVHYLRAEAFSDGGTGDYTVFVSAGEGSRRGETIRGTSSDDAIDAGGGADLVRGRGGADTIRGQGGRDDLRGGGGDDLLDGGGRDDGLQGQNGDDMIYGRGGDDDLVGGLGSDLLRGQGGDDLLRGGFQADVLVGGRGDDVFQFLTVDGSTPDERDMIERGDRGGAFDGVGDDSGDVFDLVDIDADETRRGDQEFDFGGTSDEGRGSVWLEDSDDDTILRANVDDDATIEFEVVIADGGSVRASDYTEGDFFL